jgi:hypothetical protein
MSASGSPNGEDVRRFHTLNQRLLNGYSDRSDAAHLALGVASPLLGLIASGGGLNAVFLASTLTVLCAAASAVRLLIVHRVRRN